jgi:serine/threonine-protein kinase
MSLLEPGLEIVPGLTLLRPLGRGGMGEAWLARDAARGEEVVAKVLPPDAPAEGVALLRREARLVRKLAHPRIVPVHGFRSGDRGSVVTLDYMRGGDAGRRRGATPLEAVRIGRDVAEALEFLHGLGVVHRDVKPTNVLLDGQGRAALADFGIAAVASMDEDGLVLRGGGSRASMSPQQIAGQPAHPSDDLYALGALLYELLSGRPPFPREASDDEIRTVAPPPVPSPFPVPEGLRSLVARLLAKSPEERPRTAGEVREALSRFEAELARAEVRSSGPPVRLQPPPRVGEGPGVVPAGFRARLQRMRDRPARTGPSPGEIALLVGLAVAAVVAVAWLPRWAASVPPAPSPSQPAGPVSPATAAPPALPAEAAPVPAAPPPADETDPPPPVPARRVTVATPAPAPLASPPAGSAPRPFPTPDRRQEAEALARHREAGAALEAHEEWPGALAEYEAALAIDPHVSFALEGRERTRERAALSEALDRHVRSPHRLSTEAVAREAEAFLERARGVESPGPRLRGQLVALETALTRARTPLPVVIESDGLTEVSVSRVGRLGTLTRRTLELRPGEYWATGSRRGYRDVRRRFTVSPGAPPTAVTVRCEEAL